MAMQGSKPEDTTARVVRLTETFDAFYTREFPRMVALVYAITGQRFVAEELAQEALMRAYRAWERVAGYDKPGAWLRRVTVNLATSHLRRRLIEAKALALLAMRLRTPLDDHPESDRELWNAVTALPVRQREAFALYYVDGLDVAEIAEVLDVAESTVRTHLQRARHAVLAAMGREEAM